MTTKESNVGFIIHPLSVVQLIDAFSLLYLPRYCKFLFEKIKNKIPLYYIKNSFMRFPVHKIMEHIEITSSMGAKVKLFFYMLPFFPDQIVSARENIILDKIYKCVKLAEKDKVEIIALGAFTSIVGEEGSLISRKTNLAVTSGNCFTAALCIKGMLKAAEYLGIMIENSSVLVVGAGGDIGSICAKVFSKKCKKLFLKFRNQEKSKELISDIRRKAKAEVFITEDIKIDIERADLILTATSSVVPLFELSDLHKKTIVCDVSLPFNIKRDLKSMRNDVFVFDGGRAKLPFYDKIDNYKWKVFFPNNSIYGCLAEAIILGFEKRIENYSIGRGKITEDKVEEISLLASRHGINLASFSFGSKFYSENELEVFKSNFS